MDQGESTTEVEWTVTPRLVRVSIAPDGTKTAEYESFGQAVERLVSAAEIAARARCPEEAARLAKSAASLAEWMVTPPGFVDAKSQETCRECGGSGSVAAED